MRVVMSGNCGVMCNVYELHGAGVGCCSVCQLYCVKVAVCETCSV